MIDCSSSSKKFVNAPVYTFQLAPKDNQSKNVAIASVGHDAYADLVEFRSSMNLEVEKTETASKQPQITITKTNNHQPSSIQSMTSKKPNPVPTSNEPSKFQQMIHDNSRLNIQTPKIPPKPFSSVQTTQNHPSIQQSTLTEYKQTNDKIYAMLSSSSSSLELQNLIRARNEIESMILSRLNSNHQPIPVIAKTSQYQVNPSSSYKKQQQVDVDVDVAFSCSYGVNSNNDCSYDNNSSFTRQASDPSPSSNSSSNHHSANGRSTIDANFNVNTSSNVSSAMAPSPMTLPKINNSHTSSSGWEKYEASSSSSRYSTDIIAATIPSSSSSYQDTNYGNSTTGAVVNYNNGFNHQPLDASSSSSSMAPNCHHNQPCILLTSRKPSSIGQKFYRCGQQSDACAFFQWEDSTYSSSSSSSSSDGVGIIPSPSDNHDYIRQAAAVFGHRSFRQGQQAIIEATLLHHRDVFVLMPTGGGKSLCYQLPAYCSPGVSFVFSPLLSLIQDQVNQMNMIGVSSVHLAASGGGGGSSDGGLDVMGQLWSLVKDSSTSSSSIKLAYITPEKFARSEALKKLLHALNNKGLLARFIIDEAHCISQWGHDFRPDYRELSLIRQLFPRVPLMALTATANDAVLRDSIKMLAMHDPYVHRQSFNRPNLQYHVKPKSSKGTINEILDVVCKNNGESGVVYCLSRKECETLADTLAAKLREDTAHSHLARGISFYHAEVSAEERERRQREWSSGKIHLLVATIAFGMGINKPDVRYVIHYSLPKSLTHYYQESGRAGRDGMPSDCILYFNYHDKNSIERMIRSNETSGHGNNNCGEHIKNLHTCVSFCLNEVDCRRSLLLEYFGESFSASDCHGTCDNCQWKSSLSPADREAAIIDKDVTDIAKQMVELAWLLVMAKLSCTLLQFVNIYKGGSGNTNVDKRLKTILDGSSSSLSPSQVGQLRSMCGSGKMYTKGELTRILQELVILDYLYEESTANGMGFSNEYIRVSRKGVMIATGDKSNGGMMRIGIRMRNESNLTGKGKKKKVVKAAVTTPDDDDGTDGCAFDENNEFQVHEPQSELKPSSSSSKKTKKMTAASTSKKQKQKGLKDAGNRIRELKGSIGVNPFKIPSSSKKKKKSNDDNNDVVVVPELLESSSSSSSDDDDIEESFLYNDNDDNNDGHRDVIIINDNDNDNKKMAKKNKPVQERKMNNYSQIIDDDDDIEDEIRKRKTNSSSNSIKKQKTALFSALDVNKSSSSSSSMDCGPTLIPASLLAKPPRFKMSMSETQVLRVRLRDWRESISCHEGSSGYYWQLLDSVMISDICNRLPTNIHELSQVSGMGQKKLKDYGGAILQVVIGFLSEKGIDVDDVNLASGAAAATTTAVNHNDNYEYDDSMWDQQQLQEVEDEVEAFHKPFVTPYKKIN